MTAEYPCGDKPLIPMPALTLPALRRAVAAVVPSWLPEAHPPGLHHQGRVPTGSSRGPGVLLRQMWVCQRQYLVRRQRLSIFVPEHGNYVQ
jgi:hypothetical protein